MECPVTCPECGMLVELDDLTPWWSTSDGGEEWSDPAVCQECASVEGEATDLAFKTYQLTEEQGERLEAMTAPVTVLEHDPDSGCEGCPFFRSQRGVWPWCILPSVDKIAAPSSPAPRDCNLRRGPVEVRRG